MQRGGAGGDGTGAPGHLALRQRRAIVHHRAAVGGKCPVQLPGESDHGLHLDLAEPAGLSSGQGRRKYGTVVCR